MDVVVGNSGVFSDGSFSVSRYHNRKGIPCVLVLVATLPYTFMITFESATGLMLAFGWMDNEANEKFVQHSGDLIRELPSPVAEAIYPIARFSTGWNTAVHVVDRHTQEFVGYFGFRPDEYIGAVWEYYIHDGEWAQKTSHYDKLRHALMLAPRERQ